MKDAIKNTELAKRVHFRPILLVRGPAIYGPLKKNSSSTSSLAIAGNRINQIIPTKAPKGVKLLIHENSSVEGTDDKGDRSKSFILDSAADVHPNI